MQSRVEFANMTLFQKRAIVGICKSKPTNTTVIQSLLTILNSNLKADRVK